MAGWLAFVDGITASPVVRLNLDNSAPWSVQAAGTDLSPPKLRRAVAGTLLTDGQVIPAAAYDNRVITLALDFTGAATDSAATALQTLGRELNRPTNVLQWQPGTSTPVYFRTFRSDFQDVLWDSVQRRATVRIVAEPFAYGPEENPGGISIGSDPPALGGALWGEVTGIKGDVETPLLLLFPTSGTTQPARQAVFGIKRQVDPITMTGAEQAESLILSNGATAVAVAGYSNGQCARLITFNASGPQLSGTFPTAIPGGAKEVRGSYRVFARLKKSVMADVINVQLKWGDSGASAVFTASNPAVTLPATANIVMVDLGLISVPFGPDPVTNGYSGTELASVGLNFEFWISGTGVTGNLEVDYLAFIPASDTFTIIAAGKYGHGASANGWIWDGPQQVMYRTDTLGNPVRGSIPSPLVGAGALNVSPGMVNRIYGLHDVTPGNATTLTASTTYFLRYYPRYLFVRPATT